MKYVCSALFAFTLMSGVFGQEKHKYLETNVGLSYISDYWEVEAFPFFTEGKPLCLRRHSGMQYGLAAPTP